MSTDSRDDLKTTLQALYASFSVGDVKVQLEFHSDLHGRIGVGNYFTTPLWIKEDEAGGFQVLVNSYKDEHTQENNLNGNYVLDLPKDTTKNPDVWKARKISLVRTEKGFSKSSVDVTEGNACDFLRTALWPVIAYERVHALAHKAKSDETPTSRLSDIHREQVKVSLSL